MFWLAAILDVGLDMVFGWFADKRIERKQRKSGQ